ncbi:beta-glucosidase [Geosmithia morbida]|uniref:beta-glucosidase n=1 Tax=Geosmithia morbida TaxID=1094350 RepID=A0A9P4YRK7_9HYPO|nr:beta-glucosidase [Geosmithia morbida]KAF4121257.1 beta-glucosidase [Geosmithia morbida]
MATLPSNFIWGFATAAYQIEGAVEKDGRGPSVWDTFCKKPGKIAGGESGEVACDSYNRTADDIALLKSLGAKAYRFSLSWTRIIPKGGRCDPVNQAGIDHYAKFCTDLLAAGITPFITLSHWDVPEELDRRYGGLLNRTEFPLDFENFARLCFRSFPQCRNWITFNEPWCSAVLGYSVGVFAPGRTSDRQRSSEGDSATEPWIVGHNLLVAHGRAVKAYRDDYKATNGGEIGIVLNGDATYPWDPRQPLDVEAAQRKIEFTIGWFADPIYLGEYPASMRAQLGDRLPAFTDEERALVKGSNDFYGMNHYTADFVRHRTGTAPPEDFSGNLDTSKTNKRGEDIGPETQCPWLRPCAPGFRDLMGWISRRYSFPKIYVTESGTSIRGESDLPLEKLLEDDLRHQYFQDYVRALASARVLDGVDVCGYFAWSLLDNFEWAEGYETRFGVCYVDYDDEQRRYPKKSAKSLKPLFDSLIRR